MQTQEKMLQLAQRLPTTGARAVLPFTLGGETYLAIPQLAEDIPGEEADMNGGNSNIALIIYQYKNNAFQEWQRLPVNGGEDAEFFVINNRAFLATASIRSGSQGHYNYNVDSIIYEWCDQSFVEFQRVPTFAAKQWRYCQIQGRHFLALAQGVAVQSLIPTNPYDSMIFEWDGDSFRHFQSIESAWGYNFLHIKVAGMDLLAYADHVKPSILMRWNGESFQNFQTLDGSSGRAFCYFRVAGEAYLVFANLMGDTLLYHWSGGKFIKHQTVSGPGGRELSHFELDGKHFVAQVRFLTGTPHDPITELDSVIYQFESGNLAPMEKFRTFGATDVANFSIGQETFIAVSNSLSAGIRFRTDTCVYCITGKNLSPSAGTVYQNPDLVSLFTTYTAGPTSIGSNLKRLVTDARSNDPLIVATSTDIVLYPGGGQPPSVQSFRLSTKGFKELAAISHLGPALASLVNMHGINPESNIWREDANRLIIATETARKGNSTELWRDKIAVEAYRGREKAIAAMIDYSCVATLRFLYAVLEDPSKLTPQFLQSEFLEAKGSELGLTTPFNAVMIATFFLTGLDISYRIIRWFKEQSVDWNKAMVLVCGKQGRPTSGVTWASNSVCQMIIGASDYKLSLDRLYISPHTPGFTITDPNNLDKVRDAEDGMRSVWCYTRGIHDLGSTMFEGYPKYDTNFSAAPVITPNTTQLSEMPRILGPDDWISLTTRMRLVMEDPRQLLSGCVSDYAVEQLQKNCNNPALVVVPGLDRFFYPVGLQTNNYKEGLSLKDVDFTETTFKPDYKEITVTGGQIAWWEDGTGNEIIVWVHGLPLDGRSWEAQRRHFSPLCRNIFVDLRGYGKSSKLPSGVQDVTSLYCGDLKALFCKEKLDGATLVGFASAGHVALRFAALYPSLVGKLVTINASPRFRQGEDWDNGFTENQLAHFTNALADGGIEGITDEILNPDLVFRDVSRQVAEKLATYFRPMSLNAGEDTLLGFFENISHDDDRHLLPQITAPTLVISGALGKEVPNAVGKYLSKNISNARLVELQDADHFCFATRPKLVNNIIASFVL